MAAVPAELVDLLLVLDLKSLEEERRLEPGTVELGHVHPRDEVLGRHLLGRRQRSRLLQIKEPLWPSAPDSAVNRLTASSAEGCQRYLDWAHEQGYSSRYIGSMVSDIHRILLKGGVFLYPPTEKNPEGKLRLMYEASPMAMVIEQAGGIAVADPAGGPILDIQPGSIHERTSLIIGSPREVEHVMRFWN